VVALGYNYRIDEIRSALGLAQLHKLERNNERRRQIVRLYQEWLAELAPQVSIPFSDHAGISSAHIMPVLLPAATNRTAFMEQMKQYGVQTSIHYPPIHQFTAYQELSHNSNGGLPITEEAASREVTLPLYPTMTDEQVRAVAQAVQESLAGI
jgi:dTDP-4-amino-4,6-dideoxygalactose transaminase